MSLHLLHLDRGNKQYSKVEKRLNANPQTIKLNECVILKVPSRFCDYHLCS